MTPQPDFYDWTLAIHPVANASGVAHITLTVTDEAGNRTSRTFAVTVDPSNDVPIARPDTINAIGEFPVIFDPRANDFDGDGDLLSATVLTQPQHGRLLVNADRTFTYIADSGFTGRDSASYALSDGNNGVDTGTLTFDVSAALTAVFTPVTPDPRNAGVASVDVTFSRAVDPRTLSIADFRLTRNGSPNLLGPAQSVTFVSGTTWRISGLTAPTIPLGVYEISVDARGVKDLSGNSGTNTAFDRWLMDYVPPTSRVNPLPAIATSATFTVNVTGSDLDIAGIAPSSGLDLYQIYVSTDGKPFVLYTTGKFSEGTSVNFTADGAHLYLFRSVSRDLAGNTEPKSAFAADAAIVVPDLFAPDTQVAGVNTSSAKFTVSMQGVDNGGGTLAAFDLYVSVDGSTDSLVTRVPAGAADALGVYRASVQYQAISDGRQHNYRFYTRGIDIRGNAEEAPATPADVVVSATFAPVPLTVASFDVNESFRSRSPAPGICRGWSRVSTIPTATMTRSD
ncbi:MAG: Ig-like domain-containing protein [Planctomycetota bacterium]|nr:Ig-like domain-containing protein [Planctomycetota bacterium]